MANPQDVIKAMVSLLHRDHLKSLGFGKNGSTWTRSLEWPQVINIQLSQFNSSEEAKFTVNIGVSIPPLRGIWGGLPLKGALKEYDCDLRSRIGSLLLDKHDKWWDVTETSDASHLAQVVFHDIDQHALPWLNKLTVYQGLAAEFYRRRQLAKAAVAFNLAGDQTAAEATMAEAFAEANPAALPMLRRLARTCGIPVPD